MQDRRSANILYASMKVMNHIISTRKVISTITGSSGDMFLLAVQCLDNNSIHLGSSIKSAPPEKIQKN
jgi:hypothetical protein